jgi:TonB-dependent starch-binding outer membrane protein SusC
MKLTTVFLMFCLVSVTASTYSQSTRLNINLTDGTMVDLIQQIEENSEFFFYYQKEELKELDEINLEAQNATIMDILDKALESSEFSYSVLDRYIVVRKKGDSFGEDILASARNAAIAQQRAVSGTVTDANGQPLPGVTVVVKATTQGTVTSQEGNYTISNVPENATLVFSFVGMRTQEVTVGNQSTIDVRMDEETIGLEEVVAVGYGTLRKSDLTGSAVRADMEIFEESPNVNVLQSLHGSVPGLNVGAVNSAGSNPSLSIRGTTNFAQENSPLIVLDGIIYRGNIIDINPSDIESVDILKDASSTAIYGSEASNGVILITTKKKGMQGKPLINYRFSYSHQAPTNLVKPGDAEWNIQSIRDSYWEISRLSPDYIQPNPAFDPAIYFKTEAHRDGYYNWLENGTETNWWDLLTGNSFIENHNLSLSGTSKSFDYFVSAGLTKQDGIIENDNYKRYSFRINLSSDVTEWWNLGLNTFFTLSDHSGVSVTQNEAFEYFPLLFPYNDEGELIFRPDGERLNPLKIQMIDDLNKRNNLFAIFHTDLKLPFLDGFNYRLNYSVNNQANRHYQFDQWGFNLLGEGFKNYNNDFNWTLDNIISYVRRLNDHNVNLTFVYGVEKRQSESTNSRARDFDTKILGYNSLQQGSAEQFSIISGAWEESSLYGMGRAVYSFKDKYLITGTVRRDGFSGFGENHKFGIFPSLALGWIVSEEGFIKRFDWLSLLKIRGSYGVAGRRALTRYQTLAKASSSYSYVFGDQASIGRWLTTMPNPDLKWETTTGINIGVDYALFNSRLNGNIEYYNSNTKDIIYDISLPRITGFSDISSNIGQIHNYGLEIGVNGLIVKNHNFSWEAAVNYSLNRDEIVSIIRADNDGDGLEDDLIADGLFIGQPLNVIYGFVNDGMWQLSDQQAGIIPQGFYPGTYKVKNLDEDPEITRDGDRTILGYQDPSYRIGFANTFGYRNFTLKMFINSIQGGKDYYFSTADNPPQFSGDSWDNRNKPAREYYDHWLPENPNAKYRRIDRSSSFNQEPLSQRSFIRLQDISLSYRFRPEILQQININGIRAYISGKNLITLTNWNGWDPETGQGVSSNGTPVFKSCTIGLEFEL